MRRRAGRSRSIHRARRVLHFPMDRSVGRVRLWSMPLDGDLPVHPRRADLTDALSVAEFVGLAQGDVLVPPDRGVALSLSYTRHGSLSCLRTFRPDALFMLTIGSGERFPEGEPHAYANDAEPPVKRVDVSWADRGPLPAALTWYYARIHAEDDELAWSSPIWFVG